MTNGRGGLSRDGGEPAHPADRSLGVVELEQQGVPRGEGVELGLGPRAPEVDLLQLRVAGEVAVPGAIG